MRKKIRLWPEIVTVCVTAVSIPVQAGTPEEPLLDELLRACKNKYLNVGLLFQAVGDFHIGGTASPAVDGFSIGTMRFIVTGELDNGFGYLIRTDVSRSPAILDARMDYTARREVKIAIGQFKVPFSAEFLTGAGSIDFVNRSQVVTALAPGRQIGLAAEGSLGGPGVSYAAGIFNGNGIGNPVNDGDGFLYAGRLGLLVSRPEHGSTPVRLGAGVNVAFSQDHDADFGGGFVSGFSGNRTLLGADCRLEVGRFLVSAEAITARFAPTGSTTVRPSGYHVTVGHFVHSTTQVLLRWDVLSGSSITPDSRLAIAGLNFWPTGATELQLNYVVPVRHDGAGTHRILLNAQLAF